jgi:hypothetical protein
VNNGKDKTGLISCIIEKFETCFTKNISELVKNIQESRQVTIDGVTHAIKVYDPEQCYLGSEDICLYTVKVITYKEGVFTFDDLYELLTTNKLEFHRLPKLSC